MTSPAALTIWLSGAPVATVDLGLHPSRNRLRLTYRPEVLDSSDAGTPLLSINLPVRTDSYPNAATRAFIDGLLPEGNVRRALAEELGLRADDSYGLIAALGRDCAGALVIQPADEAAPSITTTTTAEPITETKLESLVADLRSAPLGVSDRVRLSLGGVQEKLLLTRMPDGRWGQPVDGTPSTHILKPELADYRDTVENEAFCMRVAAHLGLPVARIDQTQIGARKVIVVERHDRHVDQSGAVTRIHQEDFCQATGTPPKQKYEEDGGPSLRVIARILEAVDTGSVDTLLRSVVLNAVLGNGDAHGKNFSLIHEESSALRLAPLYDLISTLSYQQNRLSMYIDSVQRTERVTRNHLINEAASWEMNRQRATTTVDETLEQLPAAIDAAADDTDGLPAEIKTIVTDQLRRIRGT